MTNLTKNGIFLKGTKNQVFRGLSVKKCGPWVTCVKKMESFGEKLREHTEIGSQKGDTPHSADYDM